MTDDLGSTDYSALAAFHDQLHRTIASTTSHTRQAGLQPQAFMLLLALRRQAEATTIVQLSETLHWNRAEVVELVDGLVRRGFVARTRDKADRRRFLISLTPAGEQWLTPLAKSVLRELVVSGPDLLRTVRVAVSTAAANAARAEPPARLDVSDFAWRAVGSAPI
jgi:DNA-binding MarR family transcriptional regulator